MFSTLRNNKKGFTLIELMIVVVIIGILAALAIPRVLRASTKSKQSEAKSILKQIYVMEHAYRQEKDLYWPATGTTATAVAGGAFADIGVEIGLTSRYTYTIVGTATTFLATANSTVLDDDGTADTWTMNDFGQLIVTSDDAASSYLTSD